MNVTVFGGSHPRPGQPAYEEAYHLGELLGRAGHTLLTGGYVGTMEAASHGAADGGGYVIGVTCEELERWRPGGANPYVMENMHFPTLNERLMALIKNCDAAIALPGGIGTLAEISMFWNHLVIDAIPPRPLVLVGQGWRDMIETLSKDLGSYIPEADLRRPHFAATVDEAFEIVSGSAG